MHQRVRTDSVLFWTIILMVCFGLVMVYSASSVVAQIKYKNSAYFIERQVVWAAISFCALMYCKRHDYRALKNPRYAFGALAVVLMLLIGVYFADGAQHRWFRTPIGSLQPSEFAKPALILFLAYFLSRGAQDINDRRTLLQATLVLVVLSFAVVVADLGTAMILVAAAGVMFFVSGLDWRYCVAGAVIVTCCAGAAVAYKPYRFVRVWSRIDPDFTMLDTINPSGRIKRYVQSSVTTRDAGYQQKQSRIAVASGGLTGVGLGESQQKWLFLPESHTDFIYAIVGEELGFAGCSAVLAGFLIIMWRGLRLYWIAPDDFGRYLALGVTTAIVLQALINISVVLDMGPTKGIPLPMISNGGSSLLSTLLCLGMLLSVSEQSS